MILVTALLFAAWGIFLLAPRSDSPAFLRAVCTYGDVLCQHPSWVLYAAGAALVWTLFLRVDRL